MTNNTTIRNTINAIEKMANIAAQEQPMMAEWFNVTVETVKKIEQSIKTNEREFDNVALALTALQCNVGVIVIDDIFEPAHQPFDKWIVKKYDITAPTPYGAIVKSSVEGLTAIAKQIKGKMDRIISLGSMVKIQAMAVDEFKVKLPEDSDDIEEFDKSIVNLEEPESVVESEETPEEIVEPVVEEPVTELATEKVEEPVVEPEKEAVEEPTLFGVPISQLGVDEIPDAGIGMPTGKRESIKIDKPLKTEPQEKKNQPVCNMPKGSVPVIIGEYDPERFCITPANNLLDLFRGTIVRTQRMHGKEFVELKDFVDGRLVGKPKAFAMEEILTKAEKMRNQSEPKPPIPQEEDSFVYVDWIPDIPKRKYKVYKSGRVYDTVNEQWMQPTSRNTINLSSGDRASKTHGVTCFKTQFMLASLVWKAFHPENRDLKKILVNFIDGNPRNCRLDNLVRKAAAKD